MYDKIQQLNIMLNEYRYGIIVNDIPISSDIDYLKYHSLSQKEFERHKIGTCWDYVNYEAWYFQHVLNMTLTTYSLQNDTFSIYYIQHEIITHNNERYFPSHTWLAFKINNIIYSFESSWKKYKGIKVYTSEHDMYEYYDSIQSQWYDDYLIKSYVILKYMPQSENLTITQFTDNVLKTGIIYDYGKKS